MVRVSQECHLHVCLDVSFPLFSVSHVSSKARTLTSAATSTCTNISQCLTLTFPQRSRTPPPTTAVSMDTDERASQHPPPANTHAYHITLLGRKQTTSYNEDITVCIRTESESSKLCGSMVHVPECHVRVCHDRWMDGFTAQGVHPCERNNADLPVYWQKFRLRIHVGTLTEG